MNIFINITRSFYNKINPYIPEYGWKVFLLIYFIALISFCFYESYNLWAPIEGPLGINNTKITLIPADPKTLNLYANKNTSGQILLGEQNKTIKDANKNTSGQILLGEQNKTIKDANGTSKISSITYLVNNMEKTIITTNSSKSSLERELTLLYISILFGILGSAIHGITSLVAWNSTRKLKKSYFSWFFIKPLIGGSLALIVYALLRASLLSGVSGVGMMSSQGFVNIYGVAGLSALVGLMTGQMTHKLRDVFDSIFGIQKKNKYKGDVETTNNNISLLPSALNLRNNEEQYVIVLVKDDNDEPLKETKVFFRISDTDKLNLLEKETKLTDTNGMTFFKVQGKSEGETEIVAYCKIAGKNILESIQVKINNNSTDKESGLDMDKKVEAPDQGTPTDKKEQNTNLPTKT